MVQNNSRVYLLLYRIATVARDHHYFTKRISLKQQKQQGFTFHKTLYAFVDIFSINKYNSQNIILIIHDTIWVHAYDTALPKIGHNRLLRRKHNVIFGARYHGTRVFIDILVLERHLNDYIRYRFALNLQFTFLQFIADFVIVTKLYVYEQSRQSTHTSQRTLLRKKKFQRYR